MAAAGTGSPGKSYILQAVEQSLRRLQTDYIDLYQLHGGTIEDPIDDIIEAFELLKTQGKVRAYGISSIRPNVIREYAGRSAIASVMMQYSLLDRRPEESCFDLLAGHQIGVVVRGGLAKGLLAGKSPRPYLDHSVEEEVAAARQQLHSLSSDRRSIAQTALRFALAHRAVTSIAAGASSLEQLDENAGSVQTPVLQPEELAQLRAGCPRYGVQKSPLELKECLGVCSYFFLRALSNWRYKDLPRLGRRASGLRTFPFFADNNVGREAEGLIPASYLPVKTGPTSRPAIHHWPTRGGRSSCSPV